MEKTNLKMEDRVYGLGSKWGYRTAGILFLFGIAINIFFIPHCRLCLEDVATFFFKYSSLLLIFSLISTFYFDFHFKVMSLANEMNYYAALEASIRVAKRVTESPHLIEMYEREYDEEYPVDHEMYAFIDREQNKRFRVSQSLYGVMAPSIYNISGTNYDYTKKMEKLLEPKSSGGGPLTPSSSETGRRLTPKMVRMGKA